MVGALVTVGLLGSLALGLGTDAPEDLPGIALGSLPLLIAERTLALFAIWLAVLVVLTQALKGRLPSEISRGGIRYADAADVQAEAASTNESLLELIAETRSLHAVVLALQQELDDVQERR